MENETKNESSVHIGVLVLTVAVTSYFAYFAGQGTSKTNPVPQKEVESASFSIPVKLGDLGIKMISVGIIDAEKFEELYKTRGGLTNETRELLYGAQNDSIKITSENSGIILNLLWALGLGNKNPILENGPMMDQHYGGAGGFASTGGWTLAENDAMDHYSRHPLIVLTSEQQKLVERVSKNIYRPCCNNPTYFPDCNHGMSMLGLLELMASQGASEEEMYKTALQVNTLWFPEEYSTIARYFASKNQTLSEIDPKEILGPQYSSASGFRRIAALVPQTESQGGSGGCGIDNEQPAVPRQKSGCGI